MFYLNGIFGWLLRFFSIALFATGASALDIGGAGDGANLGDGGDGGEGDDLDAGDGGGDGAGDGEGGDGDADLEADGQGQRQTEEQRRAAAQEARLDADSKSLLKELKESGDPKKIKLADRIRRSMFAAGEWSRIMPGGIRQAREMKTAFDEVGGADGIRVIQEERQSLNDELQQIDQAWEQADPKFIENLAEENPETFSKMAPVILENWRKVDKEGYNYTTARIFHNTLNSSGVLGVVQQLWALAQANKAQPGMAGIIEGLSQIGQFTENIRELANNQPALRTDQGLKRLQGERKKFDDDRFTAFKQDLHQNNLRNLEGALNKHLGKFLKVKNVDFRQLQARDPETFKAMVREAESRLTTALNNDRAFQQTKDRLLSNRDRAGVLRLYQQKFDYLLADAAGPKIARAVANIFFRGKANGKPGAGQGGGAARTRTNAGTNGNGDNGGGGNDKTVTRLNARPDASQIDYTRTKDEDIMNGRAYLKGKKGIHAWR